MRGSERIAEQGRHISGGSEKDLILDQRGGVGGRGGGLWGRGGPWEPKGGNQQLRRLWEKKAPCII